MSMMINSLKRRNDALQQECDTLAQGIDNLSRQLQEAYQLLEPHEPDYVLSKLNPGQTVAPAPQPAVEEAAEPTIN